MRRPLLLVGAGLLLATGGVLWLASPDVRSPEPRPALEPARVDGAPADRPHAASDLVDAAPGAVVAGEVLSTAPDRVRPGRRRIFWDAEPRPGALAAIARDVLAESQGPLGLDRMRGDLVLDDAEQTLSGWHERYRQVLDGVPVFRSEVSVHIAPDGRPLLVNADVFDLTGVSTEPGVDSATAFATARSFVRDADPDDGEPGLPLLIGREPRLVLRPENKTARLVWLVDLGTEDESVRVFVDAHSGEEIATESLRVSADGTGHVFDPNPVYSRSDPRLKDQNDGDQSVLTDARVFVELRRLDGTGFLRGKWVDVTPTPSDAQSQLLDFTGIGRGDKRFEQLMCYFHLDRCQQRLQDLGITSANAHAQPVNAHARSDDQSVYDILSDTLHFGDGGVDDAEDADIIVHEYGHSLQYAQVPNFGVTGEAGAMGEGFSDFLAVSFHDRNDSVYDPLVASWDAVSYSNANIPYLRRVDGDKVYPRDYRRQVHADGEIWSRFLWDLRGLIGNDPSVAVAVEGHEFMTPGARFRDGANAVLLANLAIRDGAQDAAIRELLVARGLPFNVSFPNPEGEDAFEENDVLGAAAELPPGTHLDLLLADEDWYRFVVPPHQRVLILATFDPDAVDLDLEAHSADGVAASSRGVAATEAIEVSAGEVAREIFLRVFDGSGGVSAGGYDLTLTEADLATLEPGQSVILDVEPAAAPVFRIPVPQAKVARKAKLKVRTKKLGKKGAVLDIRLTDPEGTRLVEFGDLRKKRGAKARFKPQLAGFWIAEFRPRNATDGRVKIKAALAK